jgi:hypothetical protein
MTGICESNGREDYAMMAHSNTSHSHADVNVGLLHARAACRSRAGRAQISRHPRITRACSAMALASALVVGSSVQALAQDVPIPEANKAWGGCVLDSSTVDALKARIRLGSGIKADSATVSFVVVYTLANDNDGQPLQSGPSNFTGPVICRNDSEVGKVGITAFDTSHNLITQTTDIPTQTHSGVSNIDILEFEQASILQYRLNGGTNAIEKRVCLTTDANVACFRIFPSP